MKTNFILTFIVLVTISVISGATVFSQCLPEGIVLNTQDQIDNFQINYPGCDEIEGIVHILGDEITNLNGLSEITHIGGNLYISTQNLINFNGLENLSSIGGYLEISDNQSLSILSGLENLSSIGDYLKISDNQNLTSLTGLDNLILIDGSFELYNNLVLNSLTGLGNLTAISEDLHILGSDALTDLTGLDNLDSIGGTLQLFHLNGLTSVSGLESLSFIGGNLRFNNNNSLNSLSGLNNLSTIGGFLEIDGNEALTSLNGLGNLESIGGKLVLWFTSLNSLSGLENLVNVGGNLEISANQNLLNLTGLESLTTIDGDVMIAGNSNLESLTGLENLDAASIDNMTISRNFSLLTCEVQSICDYLSGPNGIVEISLNGEGCNSPGEIANFCGFPMACLPFGNYHFTRQSDIDSFQVYYPGCTELEGHVIIGYEDIEGKSFQNYSDIYDLSGLSNVTSIEGDLTILGNASLSNLEGLESLTHIGGALTIGGFTGPLNSSLTSLTGLNSLDSIDGSLILSKNPALVDLSGLENLTFVGGALRIGGGGFGWYFGNNALTKLTGLENITAASIEDLVISYNSSLSSCETQSICDYLAAPNGAVEIHDNAPGCNSQDEVEEACWTVGVEEEQPNLQFNIYPNPAGDYIFIDGINNNEPFEIRIYNQTGQVLIKTETISKKMVDLSNLDNGMYVLEVVSGQPQFRKKIVKQ